MGAGRLRPRHGHAAQEELKLLLNLIRTTSFHGEYRHLVAHARLAGEVGIPRERVRHAGRPGLELGRRRPRMLPGILVGRTCSSTARSGRRPRPARSSGAPRRASSWWSSPSLETGAILAGPKVITAGLGSHAEPVLVQCADAVRLAIEAAAQPVD